MRKVWSEAKRTEVLESFALSGCLSSTAKETKVPKSTVKRIVDRGQATLSAIRARNEEIRNQAAKESLEAVLARHAELGKAMQAKALSELKGIRRTTATGVATLARAGVEIELKGLGKEEVGGVDALIEAGFKVLARMDRRKEGEDG